MICTKCKTQGIKNSALGKEFYYCRVCKTEIDLEDDTKPIARTEHGTISLSYYDGLRDYFDQMINTENEALSGSSDSNGYFMVGDTVEYYLGSSATVNAYDQAQIVGFFDTLEAGCGVCNKWEDKHLVELSNTSNLQCPTKLKKITKQEGLTSIASSIASKIWNNENSLTDLNAEYQKTLQRVKDIVSKEMPSIKLNTGENNE